MRASVYGPNQSTLPARFTPRNKEFLALERRLPVEDYKSATSRVGTLPHFIPVLFYFGLAIYAATSSVVVLAAEADVPWVWWATLFPLAISHATSGFLAFWKDARSHHAPLIWGALSGLTTVLAVVFAAWIAQRIGLWMPRVVAVTILAAVSVAGLVGLALAAKRSRKLRGAANPGTSQVPEVVILAAHKC